MLEIRTILSPVDFSETSDHALDYAVELAQKLGAQVHIIHVWQPLTYAVADGVYIPTSEHLSNQVFDLQEKLDKQVARYADRGVTGRLIEGVPYMTIVQTAEEMKADLIVMGTHGRTGLMHLLLGSVAERVVRLSPIPVLTLRLPIELTQKSKS